MSSSTATDLVRAALEDAGRTLTRLEGREASQGLLEVKEFGPALAASFSRIGARVALNRTTVIANWSRPTSQVDLVVLEPPAVEIAAELKVWDIAYQFFDLAKACCLLEAGVQAAFLICVAKQARDFDRLAGGELFPSTEGETRSHDFVDLIGRHRPDWRKHVLEGGPAPTSVPARVATTAVSVGVPIDAYPGHSARAVEVTVTDAAPVALRNGWPESAEPS